MADKRDQRRHRLPTLLIWPYAVAPAVAAVLWLFLFHPPHRADRPGAETSAACAWDYKLNGDQAMLLVSSPRPGSR